MNDVIRILTALWDSGIITAVAYFGIKLLKAHTKNKNIAMFTSWAEQAVHYAEVTYKTGPEKKNAAYNFIVKRIRANNLIGKFSTEQVYGAIEKAVAELQKAGEADEKE
ncbi:phage holin [Streptococcus gallolyticus]|uniref:Phage holin, LL-H family n=1 Tax=Streptococcus gallolyticus TaxID=315405 RepID=A0A1H9VNT5_9STRE|nr:phage holin [Streptococcus gallolyticus]SES23219.1 phage holin, LL-H family [Streptococcus gallolyticus]